MRLDFNILWVEDQPKEVAAQIKALALAMAGEGFELKTTLCSGLAEVQAKLADDIFKDEIDLILVDWDLGKDTEGGETVITNIRDNIYYKDIVFYSAVTNIQSLKEASFKEGHEGIYFVGRNELRNEVTQLFHSMIKKILDLDHTRGIVMGATSDVDQMARECLQSAHDLLDPAGRAGVLSEMVDLLEKKVPDLNKRVTKLTTSPDVANILAEHFTFTANDGLRILIRLLESDGFQAYKQHQDGIKRYIKEVVPKRNILGHKVLTPEGRPAGIAGMPGETISLNDLRELRKLLLDLRQQFRLLHVALSSTN